MKTRPVPAPKRGTHDETHQEVELGIAVELGNRKRRHGAAPIRSDRRRWRHARRPPGVALAGAPE